MWPGRFYPGYWVDGDLVNVRGHHPGDEPVFQTYVYLNGQPWWQPATNEMTLTEFAVWDGSWDQPHAHISTRSPLSTWLDTVESPPRQPAAVPGVPQPAEVTARLKARPNPPPSTATPIDQLSP